MSAVEPIPSSGNFLFNFNDADSCPTCEQTIPAHRLAIVKGRYVAHAHDLEQKLTTSISAQFDRLRADDRAAAALELANAKKVAEELVAKAQADAKANEQLIRTDVEKSFNCKLEAMQQAHATSLQQREAANEAKLTEANRSREEAERVLKEQLSNAQAERATLVETAQLASAQVEQIKLESRQAQDRVRADMEKSFQQRWDTQQAANTQAREESERGLKQQLADAQSEHARLSEAAQAAAAQMEQVKREALQSQQQLREQFEAQTNERLAAQAATFTSNHQAETEGLLAKLAAADQEKQAAVAAIEAKHADLLTKLSNAEVASKTLEEQLRNADVIKTAEVAEVRAILEQDKATAIQTIQSQHFEETQKFKMLVDTLQRKLDERDAQELGEGAELDLLEELKKHFGGDHIYRVGPGKSGADIIHEVREHGVACGKIIYDSKNRQQWREEFVTKLRADQLSEHADHAVLSSNKFRKGNKQLDLVDNVIVACPARVVMIAGMLRQHIVQMHLARASTKAKDEKAQALYAFITSPQFEHHFETVNTHITALETIDKNEAEAHRRVWANRARTINALEKVNGDLLFEVHKIIGVVDEQPTDGEV